MTQPEPTSSKTMSVQQLQQQLLQQIHDLAVEETRLTRLGFDATDANAEANWRSHLDGIAAQRETTEQAALSAGLRPIAITMARTLGANYRPPEPQPAETVVPDSHANSVMPVAGRGFLVDMIKLEWQQLRRMTVLNAARRLRLPEGLFHIGADPEAVAAVERSLHVKRTRIAVLAGVAGLTEQEGAAIWTDGGVEDMRRLAVVAVEPLDDLALEHAWRGIARQREPEVPPYVLVDPQTGQPVGDIRVLPPTIEELDANATAALPIADSSGAYTGPPHPIDRPAGAAVETILPTGADLEWTATPNPDPEPPRTTPGIGAEPD
ncbi:hypothetical protein [Nocardia transvalensis]|uniref:hypothetical protein n=1 Tax=Nocardia transvalensis TaxID=37333 RepID=UPI0018945D36|nr:hypothetical protein [Nocardia transvalensis]MBF6331821.1 hypothetical protein [Nocardia transvalensis]